MLVNIRLRTTAFPMYQRSLEFFTIRGRIISATNTINHVFVVFFGLFNGYDKMKTIGDSQNEIRAVKKCYIPLTIFYKIVMCLSTQKCVKTVA